MMGTRKYLCWVLVALMFLAVLSGGCGGSGGGGNSSSSDNGTTNENGTDSNGVEGTIEGTWKVKSGTLTYEGDGLNYSAEYIEGSASAEQFKIAVTAAEDGYYLIAVSGEGVIVDDDAEQSWITAKLKSDNALIDDIDNLSIVWGSSTYELTGTNTYTSDMLNTTFKLTSPSTILYTQQASATGTTTINFILTRVDNGETDNSTETTDPTDTEQEQQTTQTGLAGTWKTTSGTYLPDNFPLTSTSNTVTISVEKNANDDYYSLLFTGDSVIKSNGFMGIEDTYINCVFDDTDLYRDEYESSRAYLPVPVGGSQYEYIEADKTYKFVFTTTNDDGDEISTTKIFKLVNDSTVNFTYTTTVVDDEGHTHTSSMYELTFTRVN